MAYRQNEYLVRGSIKLYTKNVEGEAQWQMSTNLKHWQNIGFTEDSMAYLPKECITYYRLSICNQVFSDTIQVQLNKKDIALKAFQMTSPCADSIGIKIVNTGCNSLDFTKHALGIVFRMLYKGNMVQQESKMISNNLLNPGKQALAAGDSLLVYFPFSGNAVSGQYSLNAQLSLYGDVNSKNNSIDSILPRYMTGLVSLFPDTVCMGDSVYLKSQFPKNGEWQFSTNQQQWQSLDTSKSPAYTVETNGYFRYFICGYYSDTLPVKVKAAPPIINQESQFCNPGEQLLQIEAPSTISQLNWYKTANGKIPFHQGFSYLANINQTTKYYLESEKDGCISKERGMLKITIGGCTLEIPNVFTPNGDGINDVFKFHNAHGKTIYTKIFDRWGNKVAAFENNIGWDGKGAAAGTYYYVIETAGKTYKGAVVLIR